MDPELPFEAVAAASLFVVYVSSKLVAKIRGSHSKTLSTRSPRREQLPKVGQKVDATLYPRSADFYFEEFQQYLNWLTDDRDYQHRTEIGENTPDFRRERSRHKRMFKGSDLWNRNCRAQAGLAAKGVNAVPYAARLLGNPEPQAHTAGKYILSQIKADPLVTQALVDILEQEWWLSAKAKNDYETLNGSIDAVGELKVKAAIPLLAQILRDNEASDDSRGKALESLGRIAHHRFQQRERPLADAEAWLAKHGY